MTQQQPTPDALRRAERLYGPKHATSNAGTRFTEWNVLHTTGGPAGQRCPCVLVLESAHGYSFVLRM